MECFVPEFTFGKILKSSLVILKKALLPVFLMHLLYCCFWQLLATKFMPEQVKYLEFYCIGFFGSFMQIFAIKVASSYYRGSPLNWHETFLFAVKKFPAVILINLLIIFAWLGASILLIIPGLIVACMLYFVVPVYLLESHSISKSWKSSCKLTKGYKMRILGYDVACRFIGFATIFLLTFPFAFIRELTGLNDSLIANFFINLLTPSTIFFSTWIGLVSTAAYFSRLQTKEALNNRSFREEPQN